MRDHKRFFAYLKRQRSTLVAVFLITAIVVLMFGIASQLPGPSADDTPSGEMAINYSAFLTQIDLNNVLAMSIRGNEVDALLARPVGNPAAARTEATASAAQRTADVEAWTRSIGSSNTTNWNFQGSDFEAGRMVVTTIPSGDQGQLMSLLMGKHVTVITQSPSGIPSWVRALLKFAPLLFLLLLVGIVLRPRNNKVRIPQDLNEHMAQFTRKHIRRFEGLSAKKAGEEQKRQVGGNALSSKKGWTSRSAFTSAGAIPAQQVRLPPTTFADVGGIDEVRSELEEIVQFLRTPEKYDRLGARIPRGALLVGPPGTGKTLLARAVAGEAGVSFFSISASEFVEMFVGVGASRVRDLFQQARQAAPSVIFIDEIDAVGRKRVMKAMGNEERDQTLNQLLVELDGFDAHKAVVVMAATNRVDILDKALLRPGRFDRHITVSLPDRVGRQTILKIHSAKVPLHAEVSLERLARMTTGMSGAELANLVNEAALCAARKDLEFVDNACFEDALARIQLGALRPLVMTEAERRIIAYHEGGHALVAYHIKEADIVNRVTILPRGQSLGVTQFLAEEDRYISSRKMLMAKIAVGLGGRAAEELILGRKCVTTGAENDFQVVTNMARRMVTRWGMSEEVGVVFTDYGQIGAGLNMRRVDFSALAASTEALVYDVDGRLVLNGEQDLSRQYVFAMAAPSAGAAISPGMATVVDCEIKKILDEGYAMAQCILEEQFDQLQRLADALMEREQLSRFEFEELLQGGTQLI